MSSRLPDTAHTAQPWRIHELTGDFDLEDVWELAPVDGPADFERLVRLISSRDPAKSSSRAVRALFEIRWRLGSLLGWDDEDTGVGSRVPTLRDRLPADLRDAPRPEFDALPFTSLYLLDDEFAAEVANGTMHGVMHIGMVADDQGAFRAQMAVLVKPNGLLGAAYMAAIRPFRHLIVYPAMLREGRDEMGAVREVALPPAARRLSTPDVALLAADYLPIASGHRQVVRRLLTRGARAPAPAAPAPSAGPGGARAARTPRSARVRGSSPAR
jgi:hypothetical protein